MYFSIIYFCHHLLQIQILPLLSLTAGTYSEGENKQNKQTKKGTGQVSGREESMGNSIRTCPRYFKFSTKKAKKHFLPLPCLFMVTFLPFLVPLWIHNIEITALGEFFFHHFCSILLCHFCYKSSGMSASLLSSRATIHCLTGISL